MPGPSVRFWRDTVRSSSPVETGNSPGLLLMEWAGVDYYALRCAMWPDVGCLGQREYRDTTGQQSRSTGLQMALTEALLFASPPAPLDMGAKTPPAGRRVAHKRRSVAWECRGTAPHQRTAKGQKIPTPLRGGNHGRLFFSAS